MLRGKKSIAIEALDERPQVIVSQDGKRLDNRVYEEFRRVFLKTSVISQASGSSYVEYGRTKVMVGVYGPRQSERKGVFSEEGKVNVDVKIASFATRQRGNLFQSPEEREMGAQVQTALSSVVMGHTFPKAVLDVYCTILEAGGSETAATITAAALAVADAGVEMKDVVTACQVSKIHGDTLLLDPSEEEIEREDAGVMVAVCGKSGGFAAVTARGKWDEVQLREALELCLGGCEQLDGVARKTLIGSVKDAETS